MWRITLFGENCSSQENLEHSLMPVIPNGAWRSEESLMPAQVISQVVFRDSAQADVLVGEDADLSGGFLTLDHYPSWGKSLTYFDRSL